MENFKPASTKTILIVDDDESIRDFLDFIIKREGFKTEKAGDGEEALSIVSSTQPDLILLDLMLPKLGGFEILKELQASDAGYTPVIIITGKYMDRTTSDLIKQEPNVYDFLEKPIKHNVLTALLHKTLKTQPVKK